MRRCRIVLSSTARHSTVIWCASYSHPHVFSALVVPTARIYRRCTTLAANLGPAHPPSCGVQQYRKPTIQSQAMPVITNLAPALSPVPSLPIHRLNPQAHTFTAQPSTRLRRDVASVVDTLRFAGDEEALVAFGDSGGEELFCDREVEGGEGPGSELVVVLLGVCGV